MKDPFIKFLLVFGILIFSVWTIFLIVGIVKDHTTALHTKMVTVSERADECLAKGGEYYFRRTPLRTLDAERCEITKTIRYED